MTPQTDLIPRNALADLVRQYKQAKDTITRMAELMESVNASLKNATGDTYTVFDYKTAADLPDKAISELKRKFWRYVVERSQVKNIMNATRRKDLARQLDDVLPEFDMETVFDTLYAWTESSQDSINQLMAETFKYFQGGTWEKYKSNKKFRIGEKVVLTGAIELHIVMLSRSAEERLLDLDRVFHLLDGKLTKQYPETIDGVIKQAIREKQTEAETDYFRLKWFGNRNMHVKFKRADLLEKWNSIAGKIVGGLVGEEL